MPDTSAGQDQGAIPPDPFAGGFGDVAAWRTDPAYEQACMVVRAQKRAAVSTVQRHLRMGYNRAARLLEAMVGDVIAEPAPTTKLLPARGIVTAQAAETEGLRSEGLEPGHEVARPGVVAAVAVPPGWLIKRDGREIRVTAPEGNPGGITLSGHERSLAGRLLFALADALLAATPPSQPAQAEQSLRDAIDGLIDQHGTLRAVARTTGVDVAYLSRMHRGERENPTDETLASLGLERVVRYRAALTKKDAQA